jgi:signal transduction histidine kinase
MVYARGEGVNGRVLQTGQPVAVEDYESWEGRIPGFEPGVVRSVVGVPIQIGGQVFGVFGVNYSRPRRFSDDEIRLFQALAQRAALAIENARLYEQAQQAAAMEERQRLARDLHDSVTQSLYSLTLLAEAGRRQAGMGDLGRTQRHLERLGETAQQALREMRLLVYELRPLELEAAGLASALQQRLESVERRSGVEVRLLVEGEVNLPAAVEEGLYRVAQEALNNALKHARATSVTVTVHTAGERAELTVADDGRGFDPEAVHDRGGLGLVGIRERAQRLGGALTIESAPDRGTRVSLRLTTHQAAVAAPASPLVLGEV